MRSFLSPGHYYGSYCLILRSRKLSKYRGTVRLLKCYGLSLKEMLFFGDWRNDIPILKRAGFPVVMRNADQEVARYAEAVTLFSNEEEGVEKFLQGFFSLPAEEEKKS